jgi:hypothetical protein
MPEIKKQSIAFGLIVTIIGVVFMYLFNAYANTQNEVALYKSQVEEIKGCINDLKTDVGIIKNDLSWIRKALNIKEESSLK